MTALDFTVLGILVLSTLLAFARGVVRELLAIATWIAAIIAALAFGDQVAAILPGIEGSPAARSVIAFVLIFVGVLVAGAMVAFVLAKMVRCSLFISSAPCATRPMPRGLPYRTKSGSQRWVDS